MASDGPVRRSGGIAEQVSHIIGEDESVDALTSAVGPLGDLAQRSPGSRRRATLEP